MTIIDTHAHIDQLEDLPGALTRAHEAKVAAIMAMSVDLASMQQTLTIAKQYTQPKIYPALGIHPGKVNEATHAQAIDFLRKHIKDAVAIGETGLDYQYKWVRKDEVERAKQKDSFAIHLELAAKFNLPIVIHSRGAWRDCLAMTKAAGVTRALFHWYSGPLDYLAGILDAGYYVSTSPSVATSPQSREAMSAAPLGRILIETDCPVYYREGEGGFNAEPKDVWRTCKALAQLKNITEDEVLSVVNKNAYQFFGVPCLF